MFGRQFGWLGPRHSPTQDSTTPAAVQRVKRPMRLHLLALIASTVLDARPKAALTSAVAPGDTVVVRAGAPRHPGIGALSLERTLGTDGALFAAPSGVVVDTRGRLYVPDTKDRSIRVFDHSGRLLQTIGRAGRGPGEFQAPTAVGVLPDGRVVASDPFLARLNVYSADGRSIATWPLLGLYPEASSGNLIVDSGGTVWARLQRAAPPGAPVPRISLFVRLREGRVVDSVPDLTVPDGTWLTARNGDRLRRDLVPFRPRSFAAISPLGYWVTGENSSYTLHRPERIGSARANGRDKVLRIIGPETAPVQVLPHESRDYRHNIEERMRQLEPGWRWVGPGIPTTKPAYKQIWVDQDGRLWVQVHTLATERAGVRETAVGMWAASRWREAALWDVFEANGLYLGRLRFSGEPAAARGDWLWQLLTTEEGPVVAQYRITWGKR
jgi:hypothetical protein